MDGIVSRTLAAVRGSVRTAFSARTVAMRNRRAIVSFTFDDFPRSAVSNGARLLDDYGVRGTFYLTGSYCGRVVDDVPQYCAEDLRHWRVRGTRLVAIHLLIRAFPRSRRQR